MKPVQTSTFQVKHPSNWIGLVKIQTTLVSKNPNVFRAVAKPKDYQDPRFPEQTCTLSYPGESCVGKTAQDAAQKFCRRFSLTFLG